MSRTVGRALGVLVPACLVAACEARPIPMQVLRNSTFILPLAYAPAFGNEISAAEGIEDRQRGDLVVAICPPGDPFCSPPAQPPGCPAPPEQPTTGVYLTTRYATSVMPHPASTAGLRGYLDFAN